jgi:hypothetical protein
MATDPQRILVPDLGTPPPPGAPAPVTPSLAPIVPATGKDGTDLATMTANLFNTAPGELSSGVNKLKDAAGGMDTAVTAVSQALPALTAASVANVEKTSEQKNIVNDAARTTTDRFTNQIKPIFARQAAIDARREEVATMNPFKRALLGLVNPNYSDKHLQNLSQVNHDVIGDQVSQFADETEAQRRAFELAEQGGQSTQAIIDAHKAGVMTSLDTANLLFDSRVKQLSAISEGISSTRALSEAQQQLSDQAMSHVDDSNLSGLIGKASATGKTTFEGATLTLRQLQDRQHQVKERNSAEAEQAQHLALGNISLANASDERIMNTLNPTEFAQVRASGMYKGRPVSQQAITGRSASDLQRAQLDANRIGGAAEAGGFDNALTSYTNMAKGVSGRSIQLNGGRADPEMTQYMTDAARKIDGITTALHSATGDAKTILQQKYTAALSDMQAGLGTFVQGLAQKYGATKSIRQMNENYLTGARTDPQTQNQALVDSFNAGSPPPHGIEASGPSGAWYAEAQKQYTAVRNSAAFKTAKPAEQNAMLVRAVATAGAVYADHLGSQIQDGIPNMAKAQNHPFQQFDPNDFHAARVAGDTAAANRIATQLGVPVNQVTRMLNNENALYSTSAGTSDGKGGRVARPGMDIQTLNQQYAADSMNGMLKAMDSSPSASRFPDHKPSRAFADMMRSGQFQQAASGFAQNHAASGLGAYMADNASGSSIHGNIYTYGRAMANQVSINDAQNVQDYQRTIQSYGNDPTKRAGSILASIPGIDQHSQTVLMGAIRHASTNPAEGLTPIDAIDSLIMNSKFKDPHLERARSVAAKHWEDASTRSDKFMNFLSGFNAAGQDALAGPGN